MMEDLLHRLPEIIGRRAQLDSIGDAITGARSQVLYLAGEGGMGKTRLLLETNRLARTRYNALVVGLLDLFLAECQQPLDLMHAMMRMIRVELNNPTCFAEYERIVNALLREDSSVNEERRVEAEQSFLRDYAAATAGHVVVVTIDTFEKLHPIIAGTEDFNFRQNRQMEEWLVGFIQQLLDANPTIVLLAGRPRPQQEQLLFQRFGPVVQRVDVGVFLLEESRAYLEQALAPRNLSTEEFDDLSNLIHKRTHARPVLIAMIADLWVRGIIKHEDEIAETITVQPDIGLLINRIERWIGEQNSTLRQLIILAACLRRGLRQDLVELLVSRQLLEPEAITVFETFDQYVFVKTYGNDPSTRTITLHDEMYEALFEQVANEPYLLRWYDLAITNTREQLRSLSMPAGSLAARQRRQTLQMDLLFYRLSRNVIEGYQYYRELVTSAFFTGDLDYDDQLQDELARFFDETSRWGVDYRSRLQLADIRWEDVVFQEGIHWVYRRALAPRGDGVHLQDAVALAQKVRLQYPELARPDTLLGAGLLVAERHAVNQLSQQLERAAVEQYRDIISILQKLRQPLVIDADTPDARTFGEVQRRQATLQTALAHDHIGYQQRLFEQLDEAIDNYRKALGAYNELPDNITDTLKAITLNNYGFALMLQGKAKDGLAQVEEGLRIFEREGRFQRVAVSRNTRAQVLLELGLVDLALGSVVAAREWFETSGERSRRFLGLALRAEGAIRRRKAMDQWEQRDASEEQFAEALRCYNAALPYLREVNRQVQARQELGAAYRNRGYCRQRRGESPQDDFTRAREAFQEALRIDAGRPAPELYSPLRAVIYHDMAVLDFFQGNTETVLQALEQARREISSDYRIDPEVGVNQTFSTRQQQVYWLRIGQITLLEALVQFEQDDLQKACTSLLYACAYIGQYNYDAPQFQTMRLLALEKLRAVGNAQQLQELRDDTYYVAITNRLTGRPFNTLDQLFGEVIGEDI